MEPGWTHGSEEFRALCRKLGWSTPPEAKPPERPSKPTRRWTAADDRRFNAEYRVWLYTVGLKDERSE